MTYQRDFDKRLRIGLVGVGRHAYRNILPALTFLPVELVAVCDTDLHKAQVTATQYGARSVFAGMDEMLKSVDLDAVLLVVSASQHPILAAQSFDAGLHVWMEKPPAMRTQAIEELLFKRAEKVCVVGFKKAFSPAAQKARDFFAIAENGPITSLNADYPVTIPLNGKEILRTGEFSNWLANGCHPLSLMLSVCGPVAALITHINQVGEGVLALEFLSGAIGTLHLADGAGASAPTERYRFYGNCCSLTIENGSKVTLHRRDPEYQYGVTKNFISDGAGATVWEPQDAFATIETSTLFTQGMYFELMHFCECVLNNKPATIGSLEFAIDVMRVYEAALISEGTRIELTVDSDQTYEPSL